MGVGDFIRSGVGEMAVARPSDGWGHVTCPYRMGVPPVFAQLTVQNNEAVVFRRAGTILGVLGPGRHSLSPAGAPFLESVKSSDGGRYDCELVFVTTTGTRLPLDGSVGQLTDTSGRPAEFFLLGAIDVTTSNPAAVVSHGVGIGEPGPPFDELVVRRVMHGIRQHLGYVLEQGLAGPTDTAGIAAALQQAGRADHLGLAPTGLELARIEVSRLVSGQNRPPAGVHASQRRAEVAADESLPSEVSARFGAARLPVWDTVYEYEAHVSVVGQFEGEAVRGADERWLKEQIVQTLRQALTTWTGSVLELPQKKDEWGRYVTQVVAPQLAHKANKRGRVVIEGVEIDPQEAAELKRRRGAALAGR